MQGHLRAEGLRPWEVHERGRRLSEASVLPVPDHRDDLPVRARNAHKPAQGIDSRPEAFGECLVHDDGRFPWATVLLDEATSTEQGDSHGLEIPRTHVVVLDTHGLAGRGRVAGHAHGPASPLEIHGNSARQPH